MHTCVEVYSNNHCLSHHRCYVTKPILEPTEVTDKRDLHCELDLSPQQLTQMLHFALTLDCRRATLSLGVASYTHPLDSSTLDTYCTAQYVICACIALQFLLVIF